MVVDVLQKVQTLVLQILKLKYLIMSEYKILRVIGKGAFGDAYLGLNTKQNKEYVIKQVDIKNKSKQEKQHIFHEVKLLQQFHHVNIVSYKDSFIDKKGLLNIVMEYCEGGDMNQLIQSLQGNKIPEDKIVYWMSQIALAIFYMHQKKILHRDLKSPNIFMLKGNIRLGDFGISKVLDHVRDLAQTNIGTPYYMSPEQYNHKPYSYKSDIWAFGCILYEMCNQRRPFEANNIQALGMKVVRGNFSPVSECYSQDLRNLIGDMLSKNPAKRPNIIQILLKPFVKKKLVEYMRDIYSKRDQTSKQSLASFLEQAKKLGVVLQQKKPASIAKQPQQTLKQRSTSAKKSRIEQEKQKERKQRQRKKQQLQKQLNKHNTQRKQMAEKLKKIEEERKSIIAKKKGDKHTKAIYQKVQTNNQALQKKQYQSEKYASSKLDNDKSKAIQQQGNKQSSKNLIGKVLKERQSTLSTQEKSSLATEDITPRDSMSKNSKDNRKTEVQTSKQKINPKKTQIPKAEDIKVFKMQQEYEMEFEDCQPEEQNYQFSDQDEQVQSNDKDEFQSQQRIPTFANDSDKLAKQVQQIKNLVFVSNQAVHEMTKKQHKPAAQTSQQVVKQQAEQPKIKDQTQIVLKVQTLKQEIKMKTQHINSIRNELSNIDFQLSESEEENNQVQKIQFLMQKPSFKKKQFNPQHAKINDRINTLKESATTILGSEKYKKFYEYLVAITEKGRTVKRQYLQQVLGLQKIGAYHLVEQILRLTRVLDKIPKWLA